MRTDGAPRRPGQMGKKEPRTPSSADRRAGRHLSPRPPFCVSSVLSFRPCRIATVRTLLGLVRDHHRPATAATPAALRLLHQRRAVAVATAPCSTCCAIWATWRWSIGTTEWSSCSWTFPRRAVERRPGTPCARPRAGTLKSSRRIREVAGRPPQRYRRVMSSGVDGEERSIVIGYGSSYSAEHAIEVAAEAERLLESLPAERTR
jgi:hypothetical protein